MQTNIHNQHTSNAYYTYVYNHNYARNKLTLVRSRENNRKALHYTTNKAVTKECMFTNVFHFIILYYIYMYYCNGNTCIYHSVCL